MNEASVSGQSIEVHGILPNLHQFLLLVANTVLVGATIGMERTVVPLLGRNVYHLGTLAVMSFIVTFGLSKSLLNLVAGRWSDRVGRRRVLVAGWLLGIPMIVLLLVVHQWWAVLTANILLGANQALAWTMTVTAQMDLAGPRQRGVAMGINEATGYIGVALATGASGYIASHFGLQTAPFLFGALVIAAGLALSAGLIRETRQFVRLEPLVGVEDADLGTGSAWRIFVYTSFVEPSLSSATAGGLVNKLADTVAWGALPLFFADRGLPITTISLLAGLYTLTWGVGQFGTGLLSDAIGRKPPIVAGMFLLGIGLVLMPQVSTVSAWAVAAMAMGAGMALLYPNLNAAVGDVAPPSRRGVVLGVYRLWRDGGYALGGLLIGWLLGVWGAHWTISFIGGLVLITAVVIAMRMRETHHSVKR